jgi:hypothetical protein
MGLASCSYVIVVQITCHISVVSEVLGHIQTYYGNNPTSLIFLQKLDTLLLLCGNLAEQLACQFWAAQSRYTTTSSTEEVCGATILRLSSK